MIPSVNGEKDGKEKAIGLAIAQIERQFGKGAIMRLGAQPAALEIAVIPTGAISLDVALEVGGIPQGRVTEIFDPEASGQTTIALHRIPRSPPPPSSSSARRRGSRTWPPSREREPICRMRYGMMRARERTRSATLPRRGLAYGQTYGPR